MSFIVTGNAIPMTVRNNFFGDYCGFSDFTISHSEYISIRSHILSMHKCTRVLSSADNNYYEFESEADYTWFLMRWS